jgi:hypothetical protein
VGAAEKQKKKILKLDHSKLFTKLVLNNVKHFLALVCLTTGPIVLEDFVNPSKSLLVAGFSGRDRSVDQVR